MIEHLVMESGRQTKSAAASRFGQHGFTLIELMITLAVFAVLLAIMVPSYSDMTLGSKLRSQANDLVAGTLLARSEAIKRNSAVRMCVSDDGENCIAGGWEQGWVVFHDADDDGALDAGESVLLQHQAAPSGFKITGTVASVRFQGTGVGATQATLTACRATPGVGAQERVVNITATGRASVTKTNTSTCS
ncbi:GspH/FimT family pseudopilin [Pseudomonas sp. MMS21-TM103]|uniref:GspH/FimT family pseudopilin n=1 Tax=Pseudomonas sp. MMS21 TM103 TaxID=2886506 RepID=UPI001EDC9B55|nr:GspH/FimT family pseudopilin [Pseudomonas sp. MMS21 TM103]MCG4452060.1 GspH/FimT family pseudopilin [Pseudomonas sp. MMS21 TM103]